MEFSVRFNLLLFANISPATTKIVVVVIVLAFVVIVVTITINDNNNKYLGKEER